MHKFTTLLAVSLIASPVTYAKKTQSGRTEANTPEEQLAGFTVPDGFIIELVASEKDGVVNPIDLTFDDAGRLWTQTARMYPLDPVKNIKWQALLKLMDNPEEQDKNPEFKRIKDPYQGKTKGKDDILILSNLYDKKPLTVKKFATGLTIPQSILPYKNGAYVMQGSELFFLDDTNGDGKSDNRTPVLTGFGFTDTHTMGHTLVRAPGGWIHFSQGALNKGDIKAVRSGEGTRIDYSKTARFSLDGNHIELVTAGLNNVWGYQLRGNGQWYLTEANDLGHSVNPAEPGTGFTGIGNEKLRPYQPTLPRLHKFRVGGTGISGLAFADDTSGSYPEEYRDVAFLANPITSTINCVKVVRNPDGTVTAKHLPDLLKSKDDWFRPVNIEFGPDGCLYVADWYNKIVSHNELPTTHPDRDKSHGRIWRIRHKSQKARSIPNLYKTANKDLIKNLQSPSLWEKRSAAFQIQDRQAKELAPALTQLLINADTQKTTRIHALWALENLGAYNGKTIAALLANKDGDIRREAIRSLASFKPTPEQVAKLLAPMIKDSNVMVRSQIIRTLEHLGKANNDTIDILVSFCHPAAANNNLGGGYEINFERYLARRALERYPTELKAYLQSSLAAKQPDENKVWAQQALGGQTAISFAKQWKTLKKRPLDRDTLVIISDLSADAAIQKTVNPYFANPKNARHIAKVALEHIADAYTGAIGHPLAETAMVLIRSGKTEDIILGLKLARGYRITHLSPEFAKLLPVAKDESLKLEIIQTLSHLPKAFTKQFLSIASDPSNSSSLRIAALSALVQAQGDSATPVVVKFLAEKPQDKPSIIAALGATTQGNHTLVKLIDSKNITVEDISLPIAERIIHLLKNNPTAKAIHQHATQRHSKQLATAVARIPALEILAKSKPGNPTIGKALFTGMCLSCHVVGDQGTGIGPALDGSSKRDTNHLLTAMLNPDAAAESAYILFRTIESSGLITEGLKTKQDKRGTSISHQGGMISYIPHRTISQQHHVGSKSFMPAGLISSMPDATIQDLLAYIKTLK